MDAGPADHQRALCVLVHGVRSSDEVWDPLLAVVADDPEQGTWPDFALFKYRTGITRFSLTRRLPSQQTAAQHLRTFIDHREPDGTRPLVLVGHSQGGLVIQWYLQALLLDRDDSALRRVVRVVLFACPNLGSGTAMALRRLLARRNLQEKQLRIFNEEVASVHRHIVRTLADPNAEHPVEFRIFLGEEDGIVTPMSAQGLFVDAQTLPGDHSSILEPAGTSDDRYIAFRRGVLPPFMHSPSPDVASPGHESNPAGDTGQVYTLNVTSVEERTTEARAPEGSGANAGPESTATASSQSSAIDSGAANASKESTPPTMYARTLAERVRAVHDETDERINDILLQLPHDPNPHTFLELLHELTVQGVIAPGGFRVRAIDKLWHLRVRVYPEAEGVRLRFEDPDGQRQIPVDLIWQLHESAVEFLTRYDQIIDSANLRPADFDPTYWLKQLSRDLAMFKARREQSAGVENFSRAVEHFNEQWSIFDWGLACLDYQYAILSRQFAGTAWHDHLSDKTWIDMAAFNEAFAAARALLQSPG